jgi:hypothetical protein
VVCQPASHTTLDAWLVGVESAGDLQPFTVCCWHGRVRTISTDRDAHDVPWREGEDALWINGCERTITTDTDGTLRYRHALATPHHLARAPVEGIVQAGRARWTIANAHTHTLNTNGDPREHHDGHAQQHLAAV